MADFSQWWWQSAAAGPGPGPGPDAGDPIGQSLRFRFSGNVLQRSITTTGTNTTWTFSGWVKHASVGGNRQRMIIDGGDQVGGSPGTSDLSFDTSDNLKFLNYRGAGNGGPQNSIRSTAVFRDPSAWYHIVLVYDSTNATELERIRLYVNGQRQSVTSPDGMPAQNEASFMMTAGQTTQLGGRTNNTVPDMDDYQASVYLIDGQALEPTTFGRFNAQGVWVPVDYDGAYGTNGFHLTFDPTQDPDPQVAIGIDSSGNDNHFTATGFEVGNQASTDYDLMADSPTQNYATLNPLNPRSTTLTNANLGTTGTAADTRVSALSTMPMASERQYAEMVCPQVPSGPQYGIILYPSNESQANNAAHYRFNIVNNVTIILTRQNAGGSGETEIVRGTLPSTPGTNFVMQVAYDSSTGEVWVGVDNQWLLNDTSISTFNVSTPTATLDEIGTGGYMIGVYGGVHAPTLNYGQQPFLHQPAGFEALQTQNLPNDPLPDEITGTFTGNNSADGPFIYTGCVPGRIQYGSVDVTYDQRLGQTDVDFLSNGFKVRSTTSNSGTVNYTVTTTHTGGEYDGKKIPFYLPATATSN